MSNYVELFHRLDALLVKNRQFWQFMPFAERGFVWPQHAQFCQWLMTIDDSQLQLLTHDINALTAALMPWIEDAELLTHLTTEIQPLNRTARSVPQGFDSGIPGRKWQQIIAFNEVLPPLGLPWLEWCAGKGYLGRVLAVSHQQSVTSLEWQQQLCIDGEQAAKQLELDINFVHADAFSADSDDAIATEQHAVALHACGDLHVSLLQRVVAKKGAAVSISPCCYHLIRQSHYQPMSAAAKTSTLVLSKHDLRLPLQETVTAGNRVRQLRFVEVSFRLGFDLLQRELNNTDTYLAIPNVQKALLTQGFEAFCQWAALKKGIELPANIDFNMWQRQGEKRFAITERMELIRQLFRRPLEIWLALDRACFLEEQGYKVVLGSFCDKPITPRNLLIHAERGDIAK
ncbi:methyltransferase [Photobacterium kishitanii]|uniref:methyltransferase n=1 Tax=Photobacterium kishitanii TaxID=318456 RepID=UPI0007EF7F1F|nr:methyltransferase [Photobacterium kishitanii]OBU21604.1 SAM-dependent methyltransferase [Photobacterium kishitanii]PSW71323.1 methyltransferase [Photobacterium kishitanii]